MTSTFERNRYGQTGDKEGTSYQADDLPLASVNSRKWEVQNFLTEAIVGREHGDIAGWDVDRNPSARLSPDALRSWLRLKRAKAHNRYLIALRNSGDNVMNNQVDRRSCLCLRERRWKL